MPARLLERLTKLVVLGWAAAALVVEVSQLAAAWPELPALAIGVFVVACGAAMFTPRAIGVVLVFAYVFPAMIYTTLGSYVGQYDVLWMAALAGAMTPAAVKTSWRIPLPWRGPLVCWALVIVVGASIVAAREIDFRFALMEMTQLSNSSTGLWPAYVVGWVLHVALVLVLGILWFDWICGLTPSDLQWGVAVPLAVSCAALSLTAVYQMLFNLSAIRPNVFASIGRAAGSVLDANVTGIVAALWTGGVLVIASACGRARPFVIAVGLTTAWAAVWASGSRTAFAAAVVIGLFALYGLVRNWRASGLRIAPLWLGVGVVVFVLGVGFVSARKGVVGPITRVWDTLPSPTAQSFRNFGNELWNRNGYGEVATRMIREFPFYGVGVGGFHLMFPDYRSLARQSALPRDNAQNWYRHQLAEFGIIGSLPWIAWFVMFGAFLFRPTAPITTAAWAARGMVVGFALVSLLGMPGQDATVGILFWLAVWWSISSVSAPARSSVMSNRSWVLIAAVLVAYAAGTARVSATVLRVPARAERVGWAYAYGFYQPPPAGVAGWTAQHAVGVIDAPTAWMRLTVSEDYRTLLAGAPGRETGAVPIRPVDVRVWRDSQLVVQKRLTDTAPLTTYVRVPDHEPRILLETSASRVMRPRDFGVPDDRELGMRIEWTFVAGPPLPGDVQGR